MSDSLSLGRRLTAVLCGGFLGTMTRYLLSITIQESMGKGWPFDIFAINVTGALVLAFVTTLADALFLIGPTRRLFINVGFLGAYTTFSSLALGDAQLFAAGHAFLALLYFFLSLACGVFAVICGDWLGQQTIHAFKRFPAQYQAAELAATPSTIAEREGHVDVQDDVLLP